MRKICIVTGSRAEYGLLSRLMLLIKEDSELTLQIIATNMHLSPEFGHTYKEIEKDGFHIDKKVEMLLSSDTANATTKSVGLATIGFADAYEDLKPDLLVVLGDRFEILAAVTAALFYKIPVAHLHGGEITEGAYDDSIRHAITKMSHLHFTSTDIYRNRVIQLGEQPNRVFNVGAIGIDNIKNMNFLTKQELEKDLKFGIDRKTLLVTFHPETLSNIQVESQFQILLDALERINEFRYVFTMPNSDTNGAVIISMIKEFVSRNISRAIWFTSLGAARYLSLLNYIGGVVGNSSSGIIEVPSFGIPTINIGERQKGRLAANSVIHCDIKSDDILNGCQEIMEFKYHENINPYEKADTANEILKAIKNNNLKNIIHKSFCDYGK